MSKEIIEAANKAGVVALETIREATEINNTTLDTLVEKQLAVASQAVELGVRQLKLVSAQRDPQEIVDSQVALVEDAAEQALSNARELVELANKARDAYGKLLDKNVKSTSAAAKARKAA